MSEPETKAEKEPACMAISWAINPYIVTLAVRGDGGVRHKKRGDPRSPQVHRDLRSPRRNSGDGTSPRLPGSDPEEVREMKEKKPPISLKAVRKACSLPENVASVAWWSNMFHVWWYKPIDVRKAQERLNKLLDDKGVHDGRCPTL